MNSDSIVVLTACNQGNMYDSSALPSICMDNGLHGLCILNYMFIGTSSCIKHVYSRYAERSPTSPSIRFNTLRAAASTAPFSSCRHSLKNSATVSGANCTSSSWCCQAFSRTINAISLSLALSDRVVIRMAMLKDLRTFSDVVEAASAPKQSAR